MIWASDIADNDNATGTSSSDGVAGCFVFGSGGYQGGRGHDQGGDFFIQNVLDEFYVSYIGGKR